MRKFALVASAIAAVALTSSPAFAGSKSSGRKAQEKGVAEIPVCQKKLGTIAIVEPDNNWWQGLGLGSPEAVLKLFVMKSGCFSLVDRNKGLAGRNIERALADNGELQGGSNIGRGQVKAADYFIVPTSSRRTSVRAAAASARRWAASSAAPPSARSPAISASTRRKPMCS